MQAASAYRTSIYGDTSRQNEMLEMDRGSRVASGVSMRRQGSASNDAPWREFVGFSLSKELKRTFNHSSTSQLSDITELVFALDARDLTKTGLYIRVSGACL